MSKLTRALVFAATLAATTLAGLTAVAQPNDGDTATQREVSEGWNHYNQSTRVPPAELKAQLRADAAQRQQSDRWSWYNQATRMSPADLEAWAQAEDRVDTPAAAPAPVTAPAQPSEPGWLVVSLGVLAAAMAVVAGLALLTARRAIRTARLGHAA